MSDERDSGAEALAPGSTHYYLVRFSPASLKARQQALYAWSRELQRIAAISDPGVARLRLDWWRKELSAENIESTPHPLAAQLNREVAEEKRIPEALLEMISATEARILEPSPSDWDEFWRRHARIGGNLSLLLDSPFRSHSDNGAEAGAVNEAVGLLQTLGYHLRGGRFPFPREYLSIYSGDPRTLLDKAPRDVIEAILDEIDGRFERSRNGNPNGPTVIESGISRILLNLFRDDPSLLYRSKVDTTPLRKLWIVWRNRGAMRQ